MARGGLPRITLNAPAKVNLTLEVLGKRADGYHELRSIFRSLALHDTLTFDDAPELTIRCSDPALETPTNLAYRAAMLIAARAGRPATAAISITKRIPIAAGLGGGSSDAAAALLGLDALWNTRLSAANLLELAADLGSDVAFFLQSGTALAAGRGEQLRRLADPPDCPVLLVKPPIAVSTAAVYARVTPELFRDGSASKQFMALPHRAPPASWPLQNSLQQVTTRLFPVVSEVLDALDGWGSIGTLMCGSGPTCFGLFAQATDAEAAAAQARLRGWSAWVTHFSPPTTDAAQTRSSED